MMVALSFFKLLAMMVPWLLAGFLLAGVVSVLLLRKWVVAADAASETLAWWEHLAAAVLVALVAHGLIKTRLHSRVEAVIDHG